MACLQMDDRVNEKDRDGNECVCVCVCLSRRKLFRGKGEKHINLVAQINVIKDLHFRNQSSWNSAAP